MKELILERRSLAPQGEFVTAGGVAVAITPPIGEDYWAYRVRLTGKQSVVGFPKAFTIGIGFAVEEDWNTNLPYTVEAERIRDHIWHNRGPSIPKGKESKARVDAAIELIRQAAVEDMRVTP